MSWLDAGGGSLGGDHPTMEEEGEYLWGDSGPLPPSNTSSSTPGVDRCDVAFTYDYHVVVAVSCGMLLLFGIVYSLFGYRCFKAVMFLTGFMFGSVVVYLICLSEALLPVLGNAGVSLAAGIMFGLITMLVQYVGLFMTGFHTGLFLGVAGIAAAYPWWMPSSIWVVVGILLASGLLLAILTLYFQKGLTILGTAVSGGALMAGTLDYFIEKFMMVQWLVDRLILSTDSEAVCWFSWLILAVWPFMVVLGTLTQCCLTGTGIYHTQMVPAHKNTRNVNLQRVRSREARAEIRQKKYRYLYQVRTAHGDIISQEYIQSLQRKAYPACIDNGTLQSDSTHTTMLPPDHTPLAPLTESEDEGGGSSSAAHTRYPPHQRLMQGPHYELQFPSSSQSSSAGRGGRKYEDGGSVNYGGVENERRSYTPEYHSSPSPDEHYSELQYTPSPHSSSSPSNRPRHHHHHHHSHHHSTTPPPSPASPLPPSPPRPACVPR